MKLFQKRSYYSNGNTAKKLKIKFTTLLYKSFDLHTKKHQRCQS
jgi:hypothetical protein